MANETIWSKLIELRSQDVIESLTSIYKNAGEDMDILVEIAPWLENALNQTVNMPTTDPAYEEMTQRFKEELIKQINLRSDEMIDDKLIPLKTRFRAAARRYQYTNSSELFTTLAEIYRREIVLLNDYKNGNYLSYVKLSREIDAKNENLMQQLNLLETFDLAEWKKYFDNYQVELLTNTTESMFSEENILSSPSHAIELDLHMSVATLFSDKLKILTPQLAEKLKILCENCDQLINDLIDNYIKQWRYNQQKYGNNNFNINGADLEKLQSWCANVAKILTKIQEIIDSIQESRQKIAPGMDNLSSMLLTLRQATHNSLIKLLRGSVIIECQPPQVIKTNTKFSAVIRLLAGSALRTLSDAKVTAFIVSEIQARNALNKNVEMSCGELMNHVTKLEFNENSKQVVGNFRNLLLKNFKRVGKKSTDLVTDEKFGITFKVQFLLDGREIHEKVLSNPIVVIVHGSQETNALATVFWDNAFSEYDRVPFAVADSVSWKNFAQALNYKFYSGTGRELTSENLHFLAEKFFGHPISDLNDLMVSYSDFTKERLEGREFTFWEWFHAAFKLTSEHLKTAWMDNRVIGFIDKKRAEDLLRECVHGTFILRFSDSELGALSIAWLSRQIASACDVIHIQPIKPKEFDTTPLAKRIHQIENLEYLYPQLPKHEAFRVEDAPWSSNNYIRCITVMRVEMRPSSERNNIW